MNCLSKCFLLAGVALILGAASCSCPLAKHCSAGVSCETGCCPKVSKDVSKEKERSSCGKESGKECGKESCSDAERKGGSCSGK